MTAERAAAGANEPEWPVSNGDGTPLASFEGGRIYVAAPAGIRDNLHRYDACRQVIMSRCPGACLLETVFDLAKQDTGLRRGYVIDWADGLILITDEDHAIDADSWMELGMAKAAGLAVAIATPQRLVDLHRVVFRLPHEATPDRFAVVIEDS